MSNNNNNNSNFNNNNNRNAGGFASDPFATSSSDPFASTASSSSNFPSSTAKQQVSSVSQAADPFSAPVQPFASFSNTVNPFESNTTGTTTSSMKPSHDPFSNPVASNQAASINPFTNNNNNPFTANTLVSDPFSSNTQRSSISVSKANDNSFDPFGTNSISTQPATAAPASSSIQSLFDSVPNDPFNGSKGGFTADFTNQKSNDLFSLNLNLQNNPSPQVLDFKSTTDDLLSKQQDESEAVATEEKCKVTAGINNLVNLDLNDKKAEQNAQRRSSTQGPSLQSLLSTNPGEQRRTSIGLNSSLPQNMPIPPNDPFRRPSIPLNGIPNNLSNNIGASGFPNTANPSLAFGFGAPLPPPPQYGQIATQSNSGSLSGSFRAESANISTMMAPGMQSYNSGYSGQTGIPTNTNKSAHKSSLDSLGGWK
jgi:hypothetical protein